MEKIASFTVNHLDLKTGIYVSRKDRLGAITLTTFDLRFTRPNTEPVMVTAGIHSIEHLGWKSPAANGTYTAGPLTVLVKK